MKSFVGVGLRNPATCNPDSFDGKVGFSIEHGHSKVNCPRIGISRTIVIGRLHFKLDYDFSCHADTISHISDLSSGSFRIFNFEVPLGIFGQCVEQGKHVFSRAKGRRIR